MAFTIKTNNTASGKINEANGLPTLLQKAMLGAGWTRVTAAVDYPTLSEPSAGEVVGTEVWQMNDALAASNPVFVQLSWMAGTNASFVNLRLRVGSSYSSDVNGVFFETTFGYRSSGSETALASADKEGFFIEYRGGYAGLVGIERGRLYDGTVTPDLVAWIAGATAYGNAVSTASSSSSSTGVIAATYIPHPNQGNAMGMDWNAPSFYSNGTTNGIVPGMQSGEIVRAGLYPNLNGHAGYHSRFFTVLPIQSSATGSNYLLDFAGVGQKQFVTMGEDSNSYSASPFWRIAYAIE